MSTLKSYLCGTWQDGDGEARSLHDPTTGAEVGQVRSMGSLADAVAWAREKGGASLRALSFGQRGELLSAMAKAIYAAREELIDIAVRTSGCTRGDAKFDIDGATAVLSAYAAEAEKLAEQCGEAAWIVADDAEAIFRNSKIRGQHVWLARHGLAVHINAFNFPAWGTMEKAAAALLAGMPVLSKPATSTSLLAHRMTEVVVEAGILPEGAFSLLMGSAGDLLEHLGAQDVLAFTGSADTAATIRNHPRITSEGVRLNLEADSLNCAVVAPDIESGSEAWDRLISDCTIEMTQKAGQKCTATRKILIPEDAVESFIEVLNERLEERAGQTGNPSNKANRMGPLATLGQLKEARRGIETLLADAELVRGDPQRADFEGVESGQGAFMEPILLRAKAGRAADPAASFHRHEVFGPVSTILPYDGSVEQAAKLVGLSRGCLVASVYTDDRTWAAKAVAHIGPHTGRLVLVDEKHAPGSMSPGCTFSNIKHGGPGRAGGGEELGGQIGMQLYMNRVGLQAGASQLARLLA